MPDEHEQLVRDVMAVTGAAPPVLYEDDTPVLSTDESSSAFYFIGLIGGKDVGKSALANALAGVTIGTESDFGPGTEIATAYCHVSHAESVGRHLSREAGEGKFRLVTHTDESLGRQVLLDLPDIDSHFASHLDLTRKLLRHMLFPVWVQSVEKYADQRPQQLLAKVAAGNDPRNFLFVLSKIDQVAEREGERAADELRDDYAGRIARTLSLDAAPRVFTTATPFPGRYDLDELRKLLARQKSTDLLAGARSLASARRDRSLVAWLDERQLSHRAERLKSIEMEASNLLNDRVVVPLVETALPRMSDDPAGRAALVDATMSLRVSRWPIVPLVHTLLSPLLTVVRANSSASVASPTSPEALVDAYFTADGLPVARATQSAFALLRQSHPAASDIYDRARLWETHPSDVAGAKLHSDLSHAVRRLRETIRLEVAGKPGVVAPVVRVLFTIGVMLWFPVVQPVLEQALSGATFPTVAGLVKFVVPVLGAEYLLRSAAVLVLWFVVLYLWLRRDTQKRVEKLLARGVCGAQHSGLPGLSDVVTNWADELVGPIRSKREEMENLVRRAGRVTRQN